MLDRKTGLGQMKVRACQKKTLAGSLKETNTLKGLQQNTSIAGYTKKAEEAAWSQNHDSAASIFAPFPSWEESYVDLSTFIKSNPEMSSYKEDITRDFTCTVQGDELNTPDCIHHDFEFPTRDTVSQVEMSPQSLFEDGMWDNVPRFTHDVVEEIVTSDTRASDNVEMEVQSPLIPTVLYEEEVTSSPNEGVVAQEVNNNNSKDLGQEESYNFNNMDIQYVSSVTNNSGSGVNSDYPKTAVVSEAEVNNNNTEMTLESLLSGNNTASSDQASLLHSYSNALDLQSLLNSMSMPSTSGTTTSQSTSYLKTEPELMEVPVNQSQIVNYYESKPVTMVATGKTVEVTSNTTGTKRNDLNLDLSSANGLFDINTPDIIASLEQEFIDPETFFRMTDEELLREGIKPEPQAGSTVDIREISNESFNNTLTGTSGERAQSEASEVSSNSDRMVIAEEDQCGSSVSNPIIPSSTANAGNIIVVISRTSDGQFQIPQKEVKTEHKTDERQHIIATRRSSSKKMAKKLQIVHNGTGSTSVMKSATGGKRNTAKRKASDSEVPVRRSRGRPPKNSQASTSAGAYSRPSRQRTPSYSSDSTDSYNSSYKRVRLSSVESDSDKYRELRDKNNEASRKSRQNRKEREREMLETCTKLEKENEALRIREEEMRKLVDRLREALIEAVAKGKKENN